MSFSLLRLCAPLVLVATSPLLALAHVNLEPREVTRNATQKMVLRVPHGCQGEATTALRVDIPEGLQGVKPMPKPGWAVKTETGPLASPYTSHGKEIREGVTRILWSGGNLPDAHYDEFAFVARFSETLPAGTPVYFPVVQTCATGETAWTQLPAAGQGGKLDFPAPSVRVLERGADPRAGHGAAAMAAPNSPLRIEQAWTRATPGGAKVAGGFLRITNTGDRPDRLIGGSSDIAATVELHEMKQEGGTMKMRALENGLELKPGETVELKPGGYHIMFIDLKAPIKQGDLIRGELKFERAGTLKVEFKAEAMGGGAPKAEHGR